RPYRAAETGDAELETLCILDGLDLLAEPAAHLRARIGCGNTNDVVSLEEIVEHLAAAAVPVPGSLVPVVEPERHRAIESEGRILADKIVACRMAHLDRVVLHGIEHLQARNDLARGEDAHLELVVGHLGDALGQIFGTAENGVEALGPTRSHAP